MANAAWPTSLPSYALEQNYQENLADNNLESPMDSGLVKVRPRFTARFQRFTCDVLMYPDQSDTFEAFYNDTLSVGSLPFDWVHPRTRASVTFRFRKPAPKATTQGGVYVIWTLNLELIKRN